MGGPVHVRMYDSWGRRPVAACYFFRRRGARGERRRLSHLPSFISAASMTSPNRLPELPLVCLKSANCHTTLNAFVGKNTVIDFWTTRCTRCPDALDKLNGMAQDPKYANVDFVSICCDSCDGAREILEKPDVPRWDAMHHYFMDQESKEAAKKVLGFSMVPFYVFLNDKGEIVQKGNTNAVNFDEIPGVAAAPAPASVEREFVMDEDF